MRILIGLVVMAVLLALDTACALAADAGGLESAAVTEAVPVAAGGEEKRAPVLTAAASAAWVTRADIETTGASFAYAEYRAALEWLFLLFDVDHRRYHWRGGAGLGGGAGREPWDSLTRIMPGVQYYRELGGRGGIWAKLVAVAGFEDAVSSRAWTYNPQLLGFYRPAAGMTLYAGAGVLYHPVDAVVYPVLGVAWNRDSARGLAGAAGFPETMLRYRFNEDLALKADFQWDIRIHQLAGDNALAGKGYLRTEELVPGLHLEYSPLPGVLVSPGVRWHLDRSLTIFARNENKLQELDVDSSWAFLLNIVHRR